MKYTLVILGFLFSTFHPLGSVFAQVTNPKDSTLLFTPTMEVKEGKSNHISFALSYLANNLLFPNRLGVNFTSTYSYQVSDAFELEMGAYYLDYYDDANKRFYGVLTTSLTGDVNVLVQPFKDTPLRLGLGTAVRWYTRFLYLEANPSSFGFPAIYYAEIFQLGINAKLEYLFPIDESLDIGVRAQSQFFFHPFSVVSNAQNPSTFDVGSSDLRFGALSLGLFLRIGF